MRLGLPGSSPLAWVKTESPGGMLQHYKCPVQPQRDCPRLAPFTKKLVLTLSSEPGALHRTKLQLPEMDHIICTQSSQEL